MTDVVFDPSAALGVALATFTGEEKLNAFDRGTWNQLRDAIERFEKDPELGVLVLAGQGRAFVAGADIGEYVDASLEDFVSFQRLVRQVTDLLVACEKPIVAAVNGYALGGGLELALACDLVVASTKAKFGLPEARLGLLPGGGGTQRLPRAVGARRAKELLMTARIFEADEAFRLGLVNRLAEPDAVVSTALELAEEIRRVAPLAVRMAKRLVDRGLDLPLDRALDMENEEQPRLFETADANEGIAAFREKRDAHFTGD